MEVQFIKVNPLSRLAFDEEVGKLPRELALQLVMNVGNADTAGGPPSSAALEGSIKRRDSLATLTWSLAKDHADLLQTRALARALDVDLTLHSPYYVDFFGSQEARESSTRKIQWASVLAHGLGARLTITHLGFYGGGNRADSIQELTEIVTDLSNWLQKFSGGAVRLGIEPSGHPDVFGSREEVLELVHQVKGLVPILNLPHLAARERTNFEDVEQLEPVIQQFVEGSSGQLYLNFSGVESYAPGEFRLTPIKRGQVRFDPVAEILSDRDYDATVISSSPLLEHDAMYMKLLYERALTRRWTKRHQPTPAPPAPKAGAKPPAASSKVESEVKTVRPRPAAVASASGPRPATAPRRAISAKKGGPDPGGER